MKLTQQEEEEEKESKDERNKSFTFGVIADVQWADTEDGTNYAKTIKRCYRGAFTTLSNAVQWWNGLPSSPSFIAQLGDLIDGVNSKLGASDSALQKALDKLEECTCPTYHLVGNHELYNFNRTQLSQAAWLKHGNAEYYSFTTNHNKCKIIILDPYQLSLMGLAQNDPRRIKAVDILTSQNPNVSPDGAGGDWFKGMEHAGYKRRFVPYNGGFGQEQLKWLEGELNDAKERSQRVIVLSHVIVHPKACGGGTMAWDYEEALDIIQASKVVKKTKMDSSDDDEEEEEEEECVVKAVLCGHDHNGNYHRDEKGIHHLTFCSPLNKGDEGHAYGLVHVQEDKMEIRSIKMDDLIPNVEGRPEVKCMEVGDDVSGPCEVMELFFDVVIEKELEVVMKMEEGEDKGKDGGVEEEKKEDEELVEVMMVGGREEAQVLLNKEQAAA